MIHGGGKEAGTQLMLMLCVNQLKYDESSRGVECNKILARATFSDKEKQ